MLTTGDIQFEPQQTKIYQLTPLIGIMVSGDAVLNHEILTGVERDKSDGMSVQDAAESYRTHYQEAFLKRAEDAILAPLNLDRNTFLTKQRHMAPRLVSEIATELLRFEPSQDGVSVIFAGIDNKGPHLYVAQNASVSCYDSIGFAAIGSGSWHAQSQLMFAGHTTARAIPETMLGVYWAKKRAEVAPHVGQLTDMFSIANPGAFFRFPLEILAKLDELYRKGKAQENQARLAAEGGFNEYINRIAAAQIPPEQGTGQETNNIGGPPVEIEEGLRGETTDKEEE